MNKNIEDIEKGITLVALIITIIVLLILAAVTIFAFTKSGLLKTTSKGTESYANAQEYEKQIMNNIDKKVDDVVKNITGENGNDKPIEEFNINQEYQFTGSEQSVTLKPGIYEIECYGAEGGHGKYNDVYKYEGGKGAYTKGVITLTEETTLYLYVGGQGEDSPKGYGALGGAGGYNGGGAGGQDPSDDDSGGGGGGATDIRLEGGEWNNIESLRSRIMVAAGGSGSGEYAKGKDGGIIEGNSEDGQKVATQTSGNAFGIGGNGANSSNSAGSGAGGGYYGGFGGTVNNQPHTLGGSGSSYISGHGGCNSVKSVNNSTHTGNSVHYSNLKFQNTMMESGGNSGNGKIKIRGGTNYTFNIDQEYQFTGSEQSVTLKPGIYEIECYGAEGGHGKYNDVYKYEGGKGAYTKGVITLTEETTLYLYVGGQGEDSPKGYGALGGAGGYNGGGAGGQDPSDDDSGGGGGGATDIRLEGGEWNNIESLRSRIMVAAGGSGSGDQGEGQDGGTIEGYSYDSSKIATQTSGNAFGIGGNGGNHTYSGGSGAGGGYYGGFGGPGGYDIKTIGGSGSSYISGHSGCNSVKSVNDGTHTGNSVHYSNLKFENTIMQSGVNSGNGKIRIKNITK